MVPKDFGRNKQSCFAVNHASFGDHCRFYYKVNIKPNCLLRFGSPRWLISEIGEYTVICDDRCTLAVLLLTFTTLRPLISPIHRRPSIFSLTSPLDSCAHDYVPLIIVHLYHAIHHFGAWGFATNMIRILFGYTTSRDVVMM